MTKPKSDKERLYEVLSNVSPDNTLFPIYTIDMIHYCSICKGDEFTELAETRHIFIVQVIVSSGRKNNRYVVTLRD